MMLLLIFILAFRLNEKKKKLTTLVRWIWFDPDTTELKTGPCWEHRDVLMIELNTHTDISC